MAFFKSESQDAKITPTFFSSPLTVACLKNFFFGVEDSHRLITNVLRPKVMAECSLEANPCQLHTGHVHFQGPLFVLHVSRLVAEVLERNR